MDLRQGHFVHEGEAYCQFDFYRIKGLLCMRCEKPVSSGDKSFEGHAWHKECWACTTCNRPFGKEGFYGFNSLPYCRVHYQEMELRYVPDDEDDDDKDGLLIGDDVQIAAATAAHSVEAGDDG